MITQIKIKKIYINNQGIALFILIIIILVLFLILSSTAILTMGFSRYNRAASFRLMAFYGAEAGINGAFLDLDRKVDIDDDNDGNLDNEIPLFEGDKDGDSIPDEYETSGETVSIDYISEGINTVSSLDEEDDGTINPSYEEEDKKQIYTVYQEDSFTPEQSFRDGTIISLGRILSGNKTHTKVITQRVRTLPEAFNNHVIYASTLNQGSNNISDSILVSNPPSGTGNLTQCEVSSELKIFNAPALSEYPASSPGIDPLIIGPGNITQSQIAEGNVTIENGANISISDGVLAVLARGNITIDTSGGDVYIKGIVYTDPQNYDITFIGGGTANIEGLLIAENIDMSGATVNINYFKNIFENPPIYFWNDGDARTLSRLPNGWNSYEGNLSDE